MGVSCITITIEEFERLIEKILLVVLLVLFVIYVIYVGNMYADYHGIF